MPTQRGLGWVPDIPDKRDHPLMLGPRRLPHQVDLRSAMPAVYDQGDLGSCTANAIAGALEYDQMKQKEVNPSPFTPSRLFIYYQERVLEHTVASDGGAMIRDGMKVVYRIGAPPETDWPYDVSQFATKPPEQAYTDAALGKALQYSRARQQMSSLQLALAHGFPVVFGFSVYESFVSDEVATTGQVPMPDEKHESWLGGHAVLLVGYDTETKMWIVRNSWGSRWGQAGYCYMPFPYLLDPNLADDFWTVSRVA